jgi:hypothetical protein
MSQPSPLPSPQPGNAQMATLRRLRRLTHVLDNAIHIPGTPFRFGLDPILGLVPGGGDFLGTAVSAYIVIEAARMGLPRPVLTQMVSNIVLDTMAGTVPVLGDLVDVTWKANTKNILLLEKHLGTPQPKQQTDWLFVALLLGGLLLVVISVAAISVIVLKWLWGLIAG